MTTVYQVLCASAERYASRPFLHIPAVASKGYADTSVDYSYGQMAAQVEQQKLAYASAGYGLGHRVALLLENRAEFFIHWFSLNALGASVVPVNAEMTTDEMAYLLSHSESCLVVAIAEQLSAVQAALGSAQIDLPVLDVSRSAQVPAVSRAAVQGEPDSDSECALLYTSGSTGKPKGCVLPNEYFILCAQWYRDMGGLCPVEEGVERLLTPLPLVHMNAMACSSMVMLMTGGCII